MQAMALRIERHDGAHGFDDLVPPELTIDELTTKAAPKLRYPTTDVGSGKPLRYSMLHDGVELPREDTVGRSLKDGAKITVVHEYVNA
jgi:hypothetical protein